MTNASMRGEEPEVTEDIVRELARLQGLTIPDEDLQEVSNRFRAMLDAARSIEALDLEGIEPAPVIVEREVRQ